MIPKEILFCTDFSENSVPALNCAVEYAKKFGADLGILHVIDSWAGLPAYEHGIPLNMDDVFGQIASTSQAKLDSMVAELSDQIPRLTGSIATGIPAEEIVKFAGEAQVGLIVMGTHGWTGFRHLLLGSVAEKVLRMAECPVLVVRSSRDR